jgi:glycosyltransferase involved in cell wall biosynthesis
MKTPLISIIIPTYNRAQLIPQALDSVLSQTYTHWECLVVDDGSTDNTFQILKDYQEKDSRIKFFSRDRLPKGAPTCRNIGLAYAQGEYVIFLDSDDYLLPFCLAKRIEQCNNYIDHDFLVFPMAEKKGEMLIKKRIPYYDDYLVPFLSANLPWSIMCPIWQKTFLLHLNGFTEGYPRFNDPDLMIRALLQPHVRFKVFYDLDFDTVFIPSIKSPHIFSQKVYKSLHLFIPDLIKNLEHHHQLSYKKYLVYYLHFWFKYIFIPSGEKSVIPSVKLIFMFKRLKLISIRKFLSLCLRLLIYWFSAYCLKTPIDKLSEKAIY